jgi:hypothetical protein
VSNKIASGFPPGENGEKDRVFVQLRLPGQLGEALQRAAAEANRKLPSEITYRLQQSVSGADTSNLGPYGWVNPKRDKALGDAIGVLAGRIEEAGRISGQNAGDRLCSLSMLQIAIGEILDRMGASDQHLSSEEAAFARVEARRFLNDMLRPDPGPQSLGPRPDLDIIATLAREWEIKP